MSPHLGWAEAQWKPGVTVEERVRWSDVDAAGIICYGAYLRLYEIAETELFRAAGEPCHELFERHDVWLPRVHIESDFLRPAFLDDALRVTAGVESLGTTSIRLAFRVERAGEEIARARFVLVCVSRQGLRKRPLPASLVERLERFGERAGPALPR
ncbi:MAG: acyl-CoA thioesterase [Gemmatimonadetes bacterium]|nr:acyl-CoA thioesterase [Gemmatimonadota bacterium]